MITNEKINKAVNAAKEIDEFKEKISKNQKFLDYFNQLLNDYIKQEFQEYINDDEEICCDFVDEIFQISLRNTKDEPNVIIGRVFFMPNDFQELINNFNCLRKKDIINDIRRIDDNIQLIPYWKEEVVENLLKGFKLKEKDNENN